MPALPPPALPPAAITQGAAAQAAQAPLRFQVKEGRNLNVLVRQGPVAAHLVLRDGTAPRILFAFPAGNSGAAAWFARTERPLTWRILSPVQPVQLKDGRGRPLRGVQVELEADATRLQLQKAVLGSVRVLRDYEGQHSAPAELDAPPRLVDGALVFARDRLDGAPGYSLSMEPLNGGVARLEPGGAVELQAAPGAPLHLRVTATTGETALTPLAPAEILTAAAGDDPRARASLAFLSYREKLLAGSWRFDTYFGRDTLMSVRLLLPVLQPDAAEAGLGAVLERLSPSGEVAHEESIGEFAILEHDKAGRGSDDRPVLDYKMIDGDYLLAPVMAAYAERYGQPRLQAFLARRTGDGQRYGDLLVRNLSHVMERARPFATAPGVERLIALKPGQPVGQWRDSDTGLAGGRIPYDVNAVFVPAALAATAELAGGGALQPYLPSPETLEGAAAMAARWRDAAPGFFRTEVGAQAARADVSRFAGESGVDPAPALASLPAGPLVFSALSLDGRGRPIPVLNSDVGFDLLFGRPSPAALGEIVANVMRPFPAGLMTGVGAVVADAAYADAPVRSTLGKGAYHGAVVWAWQEAVLIAGLDRQLARPDLDAPLKARLGSARDQLWRAVQAVGETRTSELWSWSYAGGRYQVQAFGAGAADADEANAAQLWSTVFLALKARTAPHAP